MHAKILEIFKSIQGEGPYAGVSQVVVRFFECNMHCVWCDTPASIGDTTRNYKELSLEDIFAQISQLYPGCHSVSLTGGEPLLQKDFIKMLLPLIKNKGMKAYLETNGVLPEQLKDIVNDVDVIAMDIKLPSSTQCRPYWQEHEEFLKIAHRAQAETFVKTVISSDTQKEDIQKAVQLVERVDRETLFILQPNTYDLKNGVVAKCSEYLEYCLPHLPNVRVMPQMHKFMKIR
ncbi:MAG: 7-carboxy-7-deazaguanine synthase QueE [Candidatus Omnitrophica bacterium]|nr:7-carboxy-7-deazaguanine synthase QueE [Candidatus Omnitrophota bacterium]